VICASDFGWCEFIFPIQFSCWSLNVASSDSMELGHVCYQTCLSSGIPTPDKSRYRTSANCVLETGFWEVGTATGRRHLDVLRPSRKKHERCRCPLLPADTPHSRRIGRPVRLASPSERRLHGQVTADVKGGAASGWDSFRVRDDTPGMCRARTARLRVARYTSKCDADHLGNRPNGAIPIPKLFALSPETEYPPH
jgi:hypothetical protein